MRSGNIDRYAKRMGAHAFCLGDQAAIVGSLYWPQINKKPVRQPVELVRYRLQRFCRSVDLAELEFLAGLAWQPHDIDKVSGKASRLAVAVHLFEQRHIAR